MTKIITWLAVGAALLAFPGAVAVADYRSQADSIIYGARAGKNELYAKDFVIKNPGLYKRLRGQIILRVQGNGEAYYVSATSPKLIYLGKGRKALDALLYQSTGISDAVIKGVLPAFSKQFGADSDLDGLSDNFEQAIGTSPLNFNTDNDRYSDSVEVSNGFDPLGYGAWPTGNDAVEKLKGRILLQVESRGESWYVSPKDGKRYLFSTQYDTEEMIKTTGTGITNYTFNLLVN